MSKRAIVAASCEFCGEAFVTGDAVTRKAGAVVHLRCPRAGGSPLGEAQSAAKAPAAPPRVRARARTGPPVSFDSDLEERYYEHLQQRMRRGEIAAFALKPEKLRLADGAYYTPDFRVILPDGSVEFHETKGFMREAARVRLRAAAEMHPYTFLLVYAKDREFVVQPHDAKPPKSRKKRA